MDALLPKWNARSRPHRWTGATGIDLTSYLFCEAFYLPSDFFRSWSIHSLAMMWLVSTKPVSVSPK